MKKVENPRTRATSGWLPLPPGSELRIRGMRNRSCRHSCTKLDVSLLIQLGFEVGVSLMEVMRAVVRPAVMGQRPGPIPSTALLGGRKLQALQRQFRLRQGTSHIAECFQIAVYQVSLMTWRHAACALSKQSHTITGAGITVIRHRYKLAVWHKAGRTWTK